MRLVLCIVCLVLGCGPKAPPPSAADAATEQVSDAPFDPNAPLADRVALAVEKLATENPEDLDVAIAILEHSLPEDPGGATELNLGIARQRQGDLAAAVRHYEAVVARHPEWDEPWVYLGAARAELGDEEAGLRTYREALATNSENMGARIALIQALRSMGQPDAAIEEAKAALKVNANSLPVYNNFALAYLDKGDTTLARFILQKALQGIEGAVNNAYLHTNLGWSHYLDGNKPAAIQSLLKAVELEPELVPALVYLATVYLEDRNYEDMIPLLEQALADNPDNADVHLNLGIAYRGMSRFDDAKRVWERALELAPDNPDPWFNLGILLGDSLKEYEASVAAFNKYLEAGGSDPDRAQTYIDAVNRERETAERRKRAEEARKKREAERAREQELLRQAKEAEGDQVPAAETAPSEPSEPTLEEAAEPVSSPGDEADSPSAEGSSDEASGETLDDGSADGAGEVPPEPEEDL